MNSDIGMDGQGLAAHSVNRFDGLLCARNILVVIDCDARPLFCKSLSRGASDPVMIFFVVLAVYALERRAPLWLAGAALGMSVNIKVVPLVFWPAEL